MKNTNDTIVEALQQLQKTIAGSPVLNPQNTAQVAAAPKAVQSTFSSFTEVVPAGQSVVKYYTGNFFFLYSNSNANQATNFLVSFDDQSQNSCPAGFQFGAPFQKVVFVNKDTAPATVVFFVGNGSVDFKSLILSASGGISVSPVQETAGIYAALIAMGAAQKVFASGTLAQAIYLQADPGNNATVYIGFDNTVTNLKYVLALSAGQIYVMNTYIGNLYAYGSGGDNLSVSYA